jgi:hypothetical protein
MNSTKPEFTKIIASFKRIDSIYKSMLRKQSKKFVGYHWKENIYIRTDRV